MVFLGGKLFDFPWGDFPGGSGLEGGLAMREEGREEWWKGKGVAEDGWSEGRVGEVDKRLWIVSMRGLGFEDAEVDMVGVCYELAGGSIGIGIFRSTGVPFQG